MAKANEHTVPHEEGWANRREGAKRVSRIFKTKAEAQAAGRKSAMRDGVEHLIQNRDGQISERNSYGNDPARIKGWDHARHLVRIEAHPPGRTLVSLLIRFAPPSLTAQQYDDVVRRLTEGGVLPADGLDYEICFGSEGNLKVSQVWDSREQMEAFGQRLMPILAELGIDPGQPEIVEVHNVIRR